MDVKARINTRRPVCSNCGVPLGTAEDKAHCRYQPDPLQDILVYRCPKCDEITAFTRREIPVYACIALDQLSDEVKEELPWDV